MPPVQVILIAAACAGLWYGGRSVVHGAKKAGHAIVHLVHHSAKGTQRP